MQLLHLPEADKGVREGQDCKGDGEKLSPEGTQRRGLGHCETDREALAEGSRQEAWTHF